MPLQNGFVYAPFSRKTYAELSGNIRCRGSAIETVTGAFSAMSDNNISSSFLCPGSLAADSGEWSWGLEFITTGFEVGHVQG